MARKGRKKSKNTLEQARKSFQLGDDMKDEIDQYFNTPKEKNNIKEMLDNEVLALPSQSDSEEYNDFDSDEDMGDLGDEVSGDEISGDESSDYWSDEKGDGESKEDTGRWGKSKRTYYGTDYVDDEMISSDEEALEEEQEALAMQKAKAKELDEDDFMGTFGSMLKKKEKGEEVRKETAKHFANLADTEQDEKVLKIQKDASKLSQQEKMEIILNDSPELFKLLSEFKESILEMKDKLAPAMKELNGRGVEFNQGAEFLELKFLLLVNYCVNITYYLQCKASGEPVKDHPVIKTLFRFRTLLDKLGPINSRLEQQINELVGEVSGEAESEVESEDESEVVGVEGEDFDEDEDDFESSEEFEKMQEILKAQKSKVPEKKAPKEKQSSDKHKLIESSDDEISVEESEESEEEFVRLPKKRSFDSMLEIVEKTTQPPPKRQKTLELPKPQPVVEESEDEEDGFFAEEEEILKQMKLMSEKAKPPAPIETQASKKEEQKKGKKAQEEEEEEEDDGKRGIGGEIEKNRGLRKQRSKKQLKSSRATYREKHRKALIRRAGAVQPIRENKKRYSGESTGIKSHVVKSVSLQ